MAGIEPIVSLGKNGTNNILVEIGRAWYGNHGYAMETNSLIAYHHHHAREILLLDCGRRQGNAMTEGQLMIRKLFNISKACDYLMNQCVGIWHCSG